MGKMKIKAIIPAETTGTRLTALLSELAGDSTQFVGMVQVPARVLAQAAARNLQAMGYYSHCAEAGRALAGALESFVARKEENRRIA